MIGMTDFVADIRNPIIAMLQAFLDRPVILSDQFTAEPEPPFLTYTVLTDYVRERTLGRYGHKPINGIDGLHRDVAASRAETPTASFSFTATSFNRQVGDETIFGDDEALSLSNKARAFFLHFGHEDLAAQGIIVLSVTTTQNRTLDIADQIERSYGFDVRIRYHFYTVQRIASMERAQLKIKDVK